MKVSPTEFKNRWGKYLHIDRSIPVIVDKNGRKTVVLASYGEYERLAEWMGAYGAQTSLKLI
jgi:prevent-host-death family protein